MTEPAFPWEYHVVLRREKTGNRRKRVMVALASMAALVAAVPLTFNQSANAKFTVAQLPEIEDNTTSVMPLANIMVVKPKLVHFSDDDADGKAFRNLNGYYVGKARLKIDWQNVDLAQNVRYMWDRKLAVSNVSPATRKSVAAIVASYEKAEHTTTTLDKFIRRADKVVGDARAALDYPRLCAHYHLSSDRCVRLQYLSGRINGRNIVAYGMTELFPSHDGETNRKMLDMMLRRAGTDYLDAIPALGDPYLSMGFYQFTSFAVRVDEDGRQGASVVSRFAPRSQQIPGSVMKLRGDDQHRAAFYFAVQNLSILLMEPKWSPEGKMIRSGLSKKQYATLKAHSPIAEVDLTTFMAAAHHLPGGARKGVAAWLDAGCAKPLRAYLRGDLPLYGKKSVNNFKALQDA